LGVAQTNLKYGGLNPNVTRVIYTHGTLDPWYLLGITENLNAETAVILIEGESEKKI
jgi:Serine carboxypeptidase S28